MPIHSSLLAKPRLLKKLKAFYDHLQKNDGKIGTFRRGIEMNYNNACNLRCKYCFTNSPKGEGVKEFLPIKKIKEIADEADELGFIEWDLQEENYFSGRINFLMFLKQLNQKDFIYTLQLMGGS